MMRLIAVLTASVLTLAGGYVHGVWTDRWSIGADLAAAVARYDRIPLELGDWSGEVIADASKGPADAAGSLQLRYIHRKTGQTILMALVGGRPGPVSIHTPEACYGARGYVVGEQTRISALDQAGEFLTTEAVHTRTSEETRLRLFWAWNAGEGWTAPEHPRHAFAHYSVLHKLYILRETAEPNEAIKDEPCLAFMSLLLPELDRVLFAPVAIDADESGNEPSAPTGS